MADYSDDLVFDDIPSAIKAFGNSASSETSPPSTTSTDTLLDQVPATLFLSSTAPTAKMKATSSLPPQLSLPQKPRS